MKTNNRIINLSGATAAGLSLLILLSYLFGAQPAAGESPSIEISQTEPAEENICLQQGRPNLIKNPSFEGNYGSYYPPESIDDCLFGVCQTAQVPVEGSWVPFWRSHNNNDPEYIIRQPEYKPACIGTDPCIFADRLRDGREALQYFTFYSTHEAGIMQTVDVTAGQSYCLSSWGHSWSAQDDSDAISGPADGRLHQKIGIDPTGGTDWQSGNIIWSDQGEHPLGRMQYDEYGLFTVTGKAEADEITIFLYSQPEFAVKHNNVYWDDTHLTLFELTLTTTISATPNIVVMAEPADPVQVSQTVGFEVTGFGSRSSYTWSAAIDPSADFSPMLSAESGSESDSLAISVDTAGLAVGQYSADVMITTVPQTQNTPITVPVRLVIAERVYYTFLPIILDQ